MALTKGHVGSGKEIEETHFFRTVPTNSKLFLRGLLKSKGKIRGNSAFFRVNFSFNYLGKNVIHLCVLKLFRIIVA